MEYGLVNLAVGSRKFVPIPKSSYDEIARSRKAMGPLLLLEEQWDLVVENYIEFETTLLTIATREMVQGFDSYEAFQIRRARINRRVINLVTTGNLFVGQAPQHLEQLLGKKSAVVRRVRDEIGAQEAKSFAFRAVGALRNYAIHQGHAVHSMTLESRWINDFSSLTFGVTPHVHPLHLKNNRKKARSVFLELTNIGERVDLKPLLREYVETLSAIQKVIRDSTRVVCAEAEATIQGAADLFTGAASKEKSSAGIAAVFRQADQGYADPIYLLTEVIDYRRSLERKNRHLVNLRKRHVTSEISPRPGHAKKTKRDSF